MQNKINAGILNTEQLASRNYYKNEFLHFRKQEDIY